MTDPAQVATHTAKRSNQHGDFIWYELITTDADAAQKFYGAVLAWTFQGSGPGEIDYRMFSAKGEGVGGVMALTSEMAAGGMRPCWLGYLLVDDVDAASAALENAGGTIHKPAWDISDVGRVAFVADPQGALFYLMKPQPSAGSAKTASTAFAYDAPMVGHCAWNELATTDQDAAIANYSRLFGWRQEGEMDMGPMGKYKFLYQGDKMLGAAMKKPDALPASMWTYYFRVPSIQTAIATIKAHQGQVLNGPHEIPGGDFTINGMDPQGALFALVGGR